MKKKKNRKKLLKKRIAVLEQENQSLQIAVHQAENANRMKSTFLSHMSHDIRTPINGIIGMTAIAIKNLDNQDKVLSCLEKIDRSSNHLVSLINDILDMSRIESGRVIINHEPMDMRKVIESCSLIAEGLLVQRKVDFVKGFGVLKHPTVLGDELHLRQILINILGNAIKFTPDGGKIFFQVREIYSEHDKAVYHFEIEDTGIGMKPDFLEKIWDSFSQENSGNCSKHEGTGLGMAITKKLVNLMGGVIKAESEPGVGSKFTLQLTFHTSAAELKYTEAAQVPEAVWDGTKILLVEDNEINMEITKTIRSLPRIDAATVPIIAMTADAYDEDVQKTTKAGMNAHLTKPVDPGELLKTLQELCCPGP